MKLSSQADLNDWVTFINLDRKWITRVKKATKSCRECRRETAEATVWEKSFQLDLQRDGVLAELDVEERKDANWICETCQMAFNSKKALSVHAMKIHGYRNLVTHYVTDGSCPNCAKYFTNRSRLAAHLQAVSECFGRVKACFPPLTQEIIHEMAEDDKQHARNMKSQGWLKTKALVPMIKAFGPPLPPVDSAESREMLRRWTMRRPSDPRPMFEELEGFCVEIQVEEVKVSEEPGVIPFVLQSEGGHLRGEAGRYEMAGLARMHAALHIRTLCFIHFFSGYRRVGDIQHQIEAQWINNQTQIFCLSVDFCIQKEGGDLTLETSKTFWLDRIYSGAICGVGGGPPCETYTAARHIEGGPPPLRSHDWPYGLPHNSVKAWRQTRIGTILMRFMLTMVVAVARIGGAAFLEHPAYPVWIATKRPSSIWSSKMARWIKRLHCAQLVTFDQCLMGCEARKPTTLLLIRMQSLREEILRLGKGGRCDHSNGAHRILKGKDKEGGFNTAVAKVYPPKLNTAILRAIYQAVSEYDHLRERVEPLPECLEAFLSYDFVEQSTIQPDCYF